MTEAQGYDPEAEAHRLVGMFLQKFAMLETALDTGIQKILNISDASGAIVCSNMAFAKKVDVFFSAEKHLGEMPDDDRKKQLKKLKSSIMNLNNLRVMFAHNYFSALDDGISFKRVIAKGDLEVSIQNMTAAQVIGHSEAAVDVSETVKTIAETMKPFKHSFDFRDPRNSIYLLLM